MIDDEYHLGRNAREVLKLVTDTFVPSVQHEDYREFYTRKASDLAVDKELARIIEYELRPEQKIRFEQLLGYFENRGFNLLLHGKYKRFSELTPSAREKYLLGWANSRVGLRRSGFQAMKRLTLFLNYSLIDKTGMNPNRDAIGFEGPPLQRDQTRYELPEDKRIQPLMPSKETTIECDVCIVGSGAGGSVIASVLSRAGFKVLVLEKGAYNTPEDFDQQEYNMVRKLYWESGTAFTEDQSILLLAGSGAGGGTIVNLMTSLRPPQWLLQEWEGANGITGLTGPQFANWVDEVWQTLKVTADESQRNPNNEVLWRGCQKLGYAEGEDYSVISRNAYQCAERCGPCLYGCAYSGKQSTILNFLPNAYSNGARFLFNSYAQRVEVEAAHVKGVEALFSASDKAYPIHIRSKTVVVACGAIESAALLLRSGIKRKIGDRLLLHTHQILFSIYDDPILMWRGPLQTVNVKKYGNLDGDHHGFWIEAVLAHPGLIALVAPWAGGKMHKELMLRVKNAAGTLVLLREKGSGKVRIDKHGRPVSGYHLDPGDRKFMVEGILEAARINLAAGAREVMTTHNRPCSINVPAGSSWETGFPDFEKSVRREDIIKNRTFLLSAHQMGTCPMGGESTAAPVNPQGELYDVEGLFLGDGSVFPSPPGVNPMITIMAMARRTAEFIISRPKL